MENYDPCAKSVNKYLLEHSHSVQFSHSAMSDCFQPHGLQHARPPCPSPTRRAYSDLCPLNWGLLQCRRILYQLSYEGSPNIAVFFHLPIVCECFGLQWQTLVNATEIMKPTNLVLCRKSLPALLDTFKSIFTVFSLQYILVFLVFPWTFDFTSNQHLQPH